MNNDLVVLTETIIKKIVQNVDAVEVKEFESDQENTILIEVLVAEEDMGRLIGKDGKMINAIRTIVSASAYVNYQKYVNVNVNSF